MSNADNADVDYGDYDFGYMPFVPSVFRVVTREPSVDHRSHRGVELSRMETVEVLSEREAAEGTVAQEKRVATRQLSLHELAYLKQLYWPERTGILMPEYPRPWKAENGWIVDANGDTVYCDEQYYPYMNDSDNGMADFIVQCVNKNG